MDKKDDLDQTTPKDLIKVTTSQAITTHTTSTAQKSQPKQIVLDEDSYTGAISEIIKRDFFPSLITLENVPLQIDCNTNMSLDSFQTKYTSEDNASFSELMHKANEQKRQKYKWLYEKEQLSIENGNDKNIKLIEGTNQEKPAEISTWKYKVRNSLMFYPEGSQNQVIEDNSRAPPKKIVHSATRFDSAEETSINNYAAAIAAAAAGGGLNLDSSSIRSESQTPRVGGYSFVPATPSPNPSQIDSSELMTWGIIEGTPLLISGDQTPGPSFQLPPTSRRELIGMELSSSASRNMRKRNLSHKSPRISSAITRSPFSNKIASPRIRATLLSPAARSLLRKSHDRSSSKTPKPSSLKEEDI